MRFFNTPKIKRRKKDKKGKCLLEDIHVFFLCYFFLLITSLLALLINYLIFITTQSPPFLFFNNAALFILFIPRKAPRESVERVMRDLCVSSQILQAGLLCRYILVLGKAQQKVKQGQRQGLEEGTGASGL